MVYQRRETYRPIVASVENFCWCSMELNIFLQKSAPPALRFPQRKDGARKLIVPIVIAESIEMGQELIIIKQLRQ